MFGPPSRRLRAHLFRGAAAGAAAFVTLSIAVMLFDRANRPTFIPITAVFWAYSAYPIGWPARLLLGRHNFIAEFGLLPCAIGMWMLAGAAIGSLVGHKYRASDSDTEWNVRAAGTRRAPRGYVWIAIGAVVVVVFWPVRIQISGSTVVKVVHPDGTPYVGVPVRERWYVEGYGERGDEEEKRTDATGAASFPPRAVHGPFVWRKLKIFLAETSMHPTQRWGPFLGVNIQMPQGYWVPRDHGEPIENSLQTTYQDLGDSRYLTVENVDPDRPKAFITSREHSAFLGDRTLVVILRPASLDETRKLDADPDRRRLLAERAKARR